MSIFSRLSRWWRSLWGSALDVLEDPEKILMQNIRDMEEQLPKINENIAQVRANQVLQEEQLQKYKVKAEELRSKIKASLAGGKRDLAMNFATTLEQIQSDMEQAERMIASTKLALEKAMKVKEAFLREKENKRQEALRAIDKHRQAKWQKKVADTMETFEVNGIDQTHDEMIQRIDRQAAENQARMEVALESMEGIDYDLEKEAEKIRANEVLKQFELEMGLVSPEVQAEAEKTIGPAQPVEATAEKTIGPKEKVEG